MNVSNASFSFDVCALTDKGRIRSHNEDSIIARPDLGIFAVADGMGGHSAGDVASAIIVDELASLGVAVSAEDQRARLLQRLEQAHQRIHAHSVAAGGATVGATIAAFLVHEGEFSAVWAGDSRIYLMREGLLTPLTRDHSEVAMLVAAGSMTEEEARRSGRRNVITRAIGIGAEPAPEKVTGVIRDKDRILVCSDGLTEYFTDPELSERLAAPEAPDTVAASLIAETLRRGAKDNVSVVLIDCKARIPVPDAEEWLDV